MPFQNLCMTLPMSVGGANLVKSTDLPRKDLYRELEIGIQLDCNITTLGSPVLYNWTPYRAVKRIEVIADGKDTIKSISGRALLMKNFFLFGNKPPGTIPTLGTGDNWFYGTVHVPFAMPHSARPIDSLLDSSLLSTFELRITWSALTDIFSTAPTTINTWTAQANVTLTSCINLGQGPLALNVYKESYLEIPVTATSSNLIQNLPVGNLYRGFLIESEDNSEVSDVAAGTSTKLINKVTIQSGTTVYWSQLWDQIQARNKMLLDMESCGTVSAVVGGAFAGYGYVDFCPEGRLVDALDTSKLSLLQMVFDVTYTATHTTFIRVYPDELIVPVVVRAAAPKGA